MISSSRELWARVLMNEFPVRCPCWWTWSRKEQVGSLSCFSAPWLPSVVIRCSISIFWSGSLSQEQSYNSGFSFEPHPMPHPLHCLAAPSPACTVPCGLFLVVTGLWAGFIEFLLHLSESQLASECKSSRKSLLLVESRPTPLSLQSFHHTSWSTDIHWTSLVVRQDARCSLQWWASLMDSSPEWQWVTSTWPE